LFNKLVVWLEFWIASCRPNLLIWGGFWEKTSCPSPGHICPCSRHPDVCRECWCISQCIHPVFVDHIFSECLVWKAFSSSLLDSVVYVLTYWWDEIIRERNEFFFFYFHDAKNVVPLRCNIIRSTGFYDDFAIVLFIDGHYQQNAWNHRCSHCTNGCDISCFLICFSFECCVHHCGSHCW